MSKCASSIFQFALLLILISWANQSVIAQAPNISYASPQTYVIDTPISSLTPSNTGGPVFAPLQVITYAGTGIQGAANGTGNAASFYNATNIAIDASGNTFVADYLNNKIRKISPAGMVTDFAGSGAAGDNDGPGATATFNYPGGIAIDASGDIYVADCLNNKIRKITPAGLVSTIAGSGMQGANDGTGITASFFNPTSLAVDQAGNIIVADCYNHKIRKITPAGAVSTIAGSGLAGSFDAIGPAASFYFPTGIAIDATGKIYVADLMNHKIRVITSSGAVSTFAGTGVAGAGNGSAVSAEFYKPKGVALDSSGALFVADSGNHKIRKIANAGVVSDFAGLGISGNDDGGTDTALFRAPSGLYIDPLDHVFVADYDNSTIRKISPSGFTISPNLPAGLTFDHATGIISGTPTSTSPSTTYTITAFNASGSTSTSLTIAVCGSALNPTLNITTASSTICDGSSAVFTAVATDEGTNPVYQWQKNGLNVGTDSNTYTDSDLINNDTVSCILTTASNCSSLPPTISASVTMTVESTPAPLAPQFQTFCNSATIADLVATGMGIKWYSTAIGGTPLAANTPLSSSTYYVSQTVANCESQVRTSVSVSIEVMDTPVVTLLHPTCTNPNGAITIISPVGSNLEYGFNGIYQSASTFNNAPPGNYSITIRSIPTGCISAVTNAVINSDNSLLPPITNSVITYCQGAAATPLQALSSPGATLNWYSSPTGGVGSPAPPIPSTLTVGNTYYYVSQSNSYCESERAIIQVIIKPILTPTFDLPSRICHGTLSPILPNYSLNGVSGTWTPSTVSNVLNGNYTFVPDPGECAVPITIEVTIDTITLLSFTTEISNAFTANQSIIVFATNAGDYSYQLDNGPLQPQNVFTNVSPGVHTVSVYDNNDCSGPLSDNNVLVLNYPAFFTPNNDGHNDAWNIWGLKNQPNSKISIFNRYGKLLKIIGPTGQGWDGNYNNEPLPSDDYWFTVNYREGDYSKEFKSHFTLKR